MAKKDDIDNIEDVLRKHFREKWSRYPSGYKECVLQLNLAQLALMPAFGVEQPFDIEPDDERLEFDKEMDSEVERIYDKVMKTVFGENAEKVKEEAGNCDVKYILAIHPAGIWESLMFIDTQTDYEIGREAAWLLYRVTNPLVNAEAKRRMKARVKKYGPIRNDATVLKDPEYANALAYELLPYIVGMCGGIIYMKAKGKDPMKMARDASEEAAKAAKKFRNIKISKLDLGYVNASEDFSYWLDKAYRLCEKEQDCIRRLAYASFDEARSYLQKYVNVDIMKPPLVGISPDSIGKKMRVN